MPEFVVKLSPNNSIPLIPNQVRYMKSNKSFNFKLKKLLKVVHDKFYRMGEDDDKLKLVEKVGKHRYKINKGFVANMKVPAYFYSNPPLADLMFNEYRQGWLKWFAVVICKTFYCILSNFEP